MRARIGVLLVVAGAVIGCPGERTLIRNDSGNENAGAGQSTDGAGSTSAGSSSSGAGGADGGPWIPLDASDCATRAVGDCTGLGVAYGSNAAFDEATAIAHCSAFSPYDGCGTLYFQFDKNGCASAVGPGPGGWDASRHLMLLQECLTKAFAGGRFDCLGSQTLEYHESCYIR